MSRALPPSPVAPAQVECPRCGSVVVGRDFCSCGEYLAWQATLTPESAPAPEPAVYLPPAPALDPTLLTLSDPARDDEPGAAVTVSVVPGTEVVVLATIRNPGQIVDTFDVRVDGLPDGWWTVTPPTVFLNPWGTSGDYEQEVQVRLHPPRTAAAEARAWPVAVVARSRSLGTDAARAQATLNVQPFQSTVMYAGPERRRGRRHASFDVVVENHGNSPMEIVIAAQDTEAICPVNIAHERSTVAFGQTVATVVRVGVPSPLLFGRPTDHHIDVTHRATGVESDPKPHRLTFRQKPWLPWWVPLALVMIAAFVAAILLLRREPVVPKLEGESIADVRKVLAKHDLKLGRVSYGQGEKNDALDTVIAQQPAEGDEIVKGESVNIVLAAPPEKAFVPEVNGHKLAGAAAALKDAHFDYSAEPASAGDDWVVIRQHPTPGTEHELGAPVTLAVEPPPTPTPTPTPTATPEPPAPTPTPAAEAKPKAKADPKKKKAHKTEKKKDAAAKTASVPKAPSLPSDFVFAGATSGQLYRLTDPAARPARLTSPKHRFETPTTTDDGYAAVKVTDDGRHLVRISADGKTVETVAEGDFHRPVYSPNRGLLAVIAGDGRRRPADAGALCVIDPQEPDGCGKARAGGRRLGRPAWAPNGRSVLALAAGPNSSYDELLIYAAHGGDASRWDAPTVAYRQAGIQSAVWVGTRRVALLVAPRPGAASHLRLLALRADGTLKQLKDFPSLTGHELAAKGRHLALRRGKDAKGDGSLVLLDVNQAQPKVRRLSSGVNPAWAH